MSKFKFPTRIRVDFKCDNCNTTNNDVDATPDQIEVMGPDAEPITFCRECKWSVVLRLNA